MTAAAPPQPPDLPQALSLPQPVQLGLELRRRGLEAPPAIAAITTEFERRGLTPGSSGNLSAQTANAQALRRLEQISQDPPTALARGQYVQQGLDDWMARQEQNYMMSHAYRSRGTALGRAFENITRTDGLSEVERNQLHASLSGAAGRERMRLEQEFDQANTPEARLIAERDRVGQAALERFRQFNPQATDAEAYEHMHDVLAREGYQPVGVESAGSVVDQTALAAKLEEIHKDRGTIVGNFVRGARNRVPVVGDLMAGVAGTAIRAVGEIAGFVNGLAADDDDWGQLAVSQAFYDGSERLLRDLGLDRGDPEEVGMFRQMAFDLGAVGGDIASVILTRNPAAASRLGLVAPGMAYYGLKEAGGSQNTIRNQLIAKGVDPMEANRIATVGGITAGVVISSVERIPLSKYLQPAARSRWHRALTGLVAEGTTEAMQEAAVVGIEMGLDANDQSVWDNLARIGYAGALGAVAGGGINAVIPDSQRVDVQEQAAQGNPVSQALLTLDDAWRTLWQRDQASTANPDQAGDTTTPGMSPGLSVGGTARRRRAGDAGGIDTGPTPGATPSPSTDARGRSQGRRDPKVLATPRHVASWYGKTYGEDSTQAAAIQAMAETAGERLVLTDIPLGAINVLNVGAAGEVDQAKVDAISGMSDQEVADLPPVLVTSADMALADGTHRVLGLQQQGRATTIRGYVPESVAQQIAAGTFTPAQDPVGLGLDAATGDGGAGAARGPATEAAGAAGPGTGEVGQGRLSPEDVAAAQAENKQRRGVITAIQKALDSGKNPRTGRKLGPKQRARLGEELARLTQQADDIDAQIEEAGDATDQTDGDGTVPATDQGGASGAADVDTRGDSPVTGAADGRSPSEAGDGESVSQVDDLTTDQVADNITDIDPDVRDGVTDAERHVYREFYQAQLQAAEHGDGPWVRRKVPINKLTASPRDNSEVEAYRADIATAPPVVAAVMKDGMGGLEVIDGNHRVEAAKREGLKDIEVVYPAADQDFIDQVRPADLIADAENMLARLREQIDELSKEARENPLTGGLNRRTFDRMLAQAAQEADREGTPLAVIAFDAANLKTVNDTEGDAAGDAYLKQVYEAIASVTRDGAAREGEGPRRADAFHYGGDEFAILLTGLPVESANAVARDIRDRAEQALPRREVVPGVSTFLVGSPAIYEPETSNAADLLPSATDDMKARKKRIKARMGEATTREEAEQRAQQAQAAPVIAIETPYQNLTDSDLEAERVRVGAKIDVLDKDLGSGSTDQVEYDRLQNQYGELLFEKYKRRAARLHPEDLTKELIQKVRGLPNPSTASEDQIKSEPTQRRIRETLALIGAIRGARRADFDVNRWLQKHLEGSADKVEVVRSALEKAAAYGIAAQKYTAQKGLEATDAQAQQQAEEAGDGGEAGDAAAADAGGQDAAGQPARQAAEAVIEPLIDRPPSLESGDGSARAWFEEGITQATIDKVAKAWADPNAAKLADERAGTPPIKKRTRPTAKRAPKRQKTLGAAIARANRRSKSEVKADINGVIGGLAEDGRVILNDGVAALIFRSPAITADTPVPGRSIDPARRRIITATIDGYLKASPDPVASEVDIEALYLHAARAAVVYKGAEDGFGLLVRNPDGSLAVVGYSEGIVAELGVQEDYQDVQAVNLNHLVKVLDGLLSAGAVGVKIGRISNTLTFHGFLPDGGQINAVLAGLRSSGETRFTSAEGQAKFEAQQEDRGRRRPPDDTSERIEGMPTPTHSRRLKELGGKVEAAIEAVGWDIGRGFSAPSYSDSIYLTATNPDEDSDVPHLEIRISDHDQPAGGGFNQGTGERFGESDILIEIDSGPDAGLFFDEYGGIGSRPLARIETQHEADEPGAEALVQALGPVVEQYAQLLAKRKAAQEKAKQTREDRRRQKANDESEQQQQRVDAAYAAMPESILDEGALLYARSKHPALSRQSTNRARGRFFEWQERTLPSNERVGVLRAEPPDALTRRAEDLSREVVGEESEAQRVGELFDRAIALAQEKARIAGGSVTERSLSNPRPAGEAGDVPSVPDVTPESSIEGMPEGIANPPFDPDTGVVATTATAVPGTPIAQRQDWTVPTSQGPTQTASVRRNRRDTPKQVRRSIVAARARAQREGRAEASESDNIYRITSDLYRRLGLGAPGVGRSSALRKSVAGFYRPQANAVRLKRGSYVTTAIHELGHHIHKVMFPGTKHERGKPFRASQFPKEWSADLALLGRDLYGDKQPAGGYQSEGWAEVIRFLVTNPQHLKQRTPALYHAVVTQLKTYHPETYRALLDARVRLRNAVSAAMQDPVDQYVAHDNSPTSINKTTLWDAVRTRIFDRFQRLVTFKEDLGLGDLPADQDPHLAALRANGHISGDVKFAVEVGTFDPFDPKKTPTGPSLSAILEPAVQDMRMWQNYMVARRVLEKRTQGYEPLPQDPNLPDMTSSPRLEAFIKRVEKLHPEWGDYFKRRGEPTVNEDGETVGTEASDTVAARFQQFNQWLIRDYATRYGLISPETAEVIIEKNLEYITFRHKKVEDAVAKKMGIKSTAGGFVNTGTGIGRFREGKGEQLFPPLESFMVVMQGVMSRARLNQVGQMVTSEFSKGTPGIGRWIDKIDRPVEGTRVSVEQLSDEIRKQLGIGITDDGRVSIPDYLQDLTDLQFEQLIASLQGLEGATFWKPGNRTDRDNREVSVLRGGEPQFYEVKDAQLFDLLEGLGNPTATHAFVKIIGAPGRLLRMGATQLNVSFTFANMVRDMIQAIAFTDTDLRDAKRQVRLRLQGMKQAFTGGNWYDLFLAGGADMAGIFGEYYDSRRRVLDINKVLQKTKYGIVKGNTAKEIAKDVATLGWLSRLNSSIEMSVRLGELAVTYEQAKAGGRTESEAVALSGQAAADITLDFQRGGTWAKQINEAVVFFNAALLGVDKLARTIKNNKARSFGRIISLMIIPSIAQALLNWDNDDYWAKPRRDRDRYWYFPLGDDDLGRPTYLRLPKPYGLAAFSIAFERGFASLWGIDPETGQRGDPKATDGILAAMREEFMPSLNLAGILPIIEVSAGDQGWSFYRDQTIVSGADKNLPYGEQGATRSSATARMLGRWLDYPPAKIDYLISGFVGGLGRDITNTLVDPVVSLADTEGKSGEPMSYEDFALVRRFIAGDSGSRHEAISRFFDEYEKLERVNRGLKSREDRPAEYDRYLSQHRAEIDLWPTYSSAQRRMADRFSELRSLYRRRDQMDPDEFEQSVDQMYQEIIGIAQETRLIQQQTEDATP